jgi:ribosomal protein S27E
MAGIFLLIGVQNCLTNVTRGHSIASQLKAAILKEMNCTRKLKGYTLSCCQVKQHATRHAQKAIVICPRCGKKQTVLAINTKFMVICPQCGAGMREQKVRSRFAE